MGKIILKRDAGDREYIEAVWGIGFKLREDEAVEP